MERGLPLGRRAGCKAGEGGEGGGGDVGGGGGEGVAKPQRSSRASSARRRPLLSLGKELSVASGSLLDMSEPLRDTRVSARWRLLPLSVPGEDTSDCYTHSSFDAWKNGNRNTQAIRATHSAHFKVNTSQHTMWADYREFTTSPTLQDHNVNSNLVFAVKDTQSEMDIRNL